MFEFDHAGYLQQQVGSFILFVLIILVYYCLGVCLSYWLSFIWFMYINFGYLCLLSFFICILYSFVLYIHVLLLS